MKAIYEQHEDATIIKVQGRIDIGVGDIQLRRCVNEVASARKAPIILDLGKISYMDSAGIGELVALNKSLREKGIVLYLTHLRSKIYGLLDLTRLITVFSIYDSNEDALQVLGQAA